MPSETTRPALDLRRLGVIRHPTRDVSRALGAISGWAAAHDAEIVLGDGAPLDAAGCDLVIAVGGDGTVLAAVRAGAPAGAPVLGVACGSLGALTAVDADAVPAALDALVAGPWPARSLPALRVEPTAGDPVEAFNDLVVVRAAGSQVRVEVEVDGVRWARWAGDGIIVATALGSTAYTLAVGGPVLAPGTIACVVTPLAPHGGKIPPLVVPDVAELVVCVDGGHGGARVEIDGRPSRLDPAEVRLALRPAAATLVRPARGEDVLSGLRRRGLVVDSPRVLAHERRLARAATQHDRPG